MGEQVAFFSKGLFTKELRAHERSLTSLQKVFIHNAVRLSQKARIRRCDESEV